MTCQIPDETVKRVVNFHGHSCPGLAIGIRVSELARRELGELSGSEIVCVAETDMCGVDAVQYLTGCTFGKGNLIHRDYGKMAFTFFNRKEGRGFRCLLKSEAMDEISDEMSMLQRKVAVGEASDEEQMRCNELRLRMEERLMISGLDELFEVMESKEPMPGSARILVSLVCEGCGESTMESRTRRFAGKTLCQPCFDKVEQKA